MSSVGPLRIGLGVAALLIVQETPAAGATFSLERGEDGFDFIFIEGEIRPGDDDHFRRLAVGSDSAAVVVKGPGGALITALEIGKTIQLKGFGTFVPDGAECTSACALIWVAGSTRFLTPTSRVGFHASYRDVDGRLEEAGVANAIVGRYLTLLNLPEKAIIFATSASPTQISWLTSDNSQRAGIDFELLPELSRTSEPEPYVAEGDPSSLTANQQDNTVPSWFYAGISSSGSLSYVRGEDVMAGRADSRAARMWVRTDSSQDRTVSWNSALALYTVDCVAETYRLEALTTYDRSGRAKGEDVPGRLEHIVPGSLMESATSLVCTDDSPGSDERDIP